MENSKIKKLVFPAGCLPEEVVNSLHQAVCHFPKYSIASSNGSVIMTLEDESIVVLMPHVVEALIQSVHESAARKAAAETKKAQGE